MHLCHQSDQLSLEWWELKNLCMSNNCQGRSRLFAFEICIKPKNTSKDMTFADIMADIWQDHESFTVTERNRQHGNAFGKKIQQNILYAAWKHDPDIFQQCVRWLSICSLQGWSSLQRCYNIFFRHLHRHLTDIKATASYRPKNKITNWILDMWVFLFANLQTYELSYIDLT